MKIENQLTKTVNYYTLIYREVGYYNTKAPLSVRSRRGTDTNVRQTAPKKNPRANSNGKMLNSYERRCFEEKESKRKEIKVGP